MALSPIDEGTMADIGGLSSWLQDHNEIRRLFAVYKDSSGDDAPLKRAAVDIAHAISVHQWAEQRTLYPRFAKLPESMGGKALQSHGQLVDELVQRMLDWLHDYKEPRNDTEWRLYDDTMRLLMLTMELHMTYEEEVGAAYLTKHLTGGELATLGRGYEAHKRIAPTHPQGQGSGIFAKIAHTLKDTIAVDPYAPLLDGRR